MKSLGLNPVFESGALRCAMGARQRRSDGERLWTACGRVVSRARRIGGTARKQESRVARGGVFVLAPELLGRCDMIEAIDS